MWIHSPLEITYEVMFSFIMIANVAVVEKFIDVLHEF